MKFCVNKNKSEIKNKSKINWINEEKNEITQSTPYWQKESLKI